MTNRDAERTALLVGLGSAVVAAALLVAVPGQALAPRIVMATFGLAAWVAAAALRWMVSVALLGVVLQVSLVEADGVPAALAAALAGGLALAAVESLHLRRVWHRALEWSWEIERQHTVGALRRVLAGTALGVVGAAMVAAPAAPHFAAAAGGVVGLVIIVWTIARLGDGGRNRRAVTRLGR